MEHVVFYSGGLASFFTARRVVERCGPDDVKLLFTDTKIEDPTLYTFLRESALWLGCELIELADGRDVWEVFFDVKMMGSSRSDPCSRVLKREISHKWVEENYPDPKTVTLHIGYDWSEGHRFDRSAKAWEPYTVEAPLLDPPYITRPEMIEECKTIGLEPCALYAQGAQHANCGGFCVKAGITQFSWLLRNKPDLYAYHEAKEIEFNAFLKADRESNGKDYRPVSILRDRTGGESTPLSMTELRERIADGQQTPEFDWGGCGCFSE